jgi:tetratricopeptide (TPR) repeat protein
MRKATPVWASILVLAALSGPSLAAPFAEISAALAAGNGAEALRLADAGLGEADLSEADRARLIADRGFALNLGGDTDGALADLTQALDAKSLTTQEQARLYLERGLILDSLNRLDNAVGDYSAALRLAPNSAPALNNRANVFRRQNRFEDARRDYLASLAADNPAPEYPYYGLGQVAESEGKPDQARNFYARALAANPGYSLAAERVAALGGAAPQTQAITLKPPKGVSAEDAPVVLHPPAAKPTAAPARAQAQPRKPAAPSHPEDTVSLRPALDNPAGEQAQLGAWRSEGEAAAGWRRALTQANGALGEFSPHIVAVDLPGRGRFYRLRVVTLDAKHLCATLTNQGVACIPARN